MQSTNDAKVPLTLGVKMIHKEEHKGIHVAFELKNKEASDNECGILLYDRESGDLIKRHVIREDHAIGNVRYDFIEDIDNFDIA